MSTPEHRPATTPAPNAKTKPHVLAIIALVFAAIGFLFACIPGALIVGWICLPIAFILSLVALFLKGRKWPAVVGLILSIVGTIVGVVVFLGVVASAADEAFGDTETNVTQPADQENGTDGSRTSEGSASESGTRENPAPLGSTISGDEYDVVVNSVTLNATDQVLAATSFNDAPAEGFAYAIVNATITYTGEDSGHAAMVGFSYVTSEGNVISTSDSFAVAPDPTLGLEELYSGASATGNVVLSIPVDDAGTLRVRPGIVSDEVFVALQ